MSGIILTTINARYVHAALGLRYLRANMGPLREATQIREFVLGDRPADIAERLLAELETARTVRGQVESMASSLCCSRRL